MADRNEMDKGLLSAIRSLLENKEKSFVPVYLQNLPAGKIPKWKVELLGNIQIWNSGHKKDLIKIDSADDLDKSEILTRVIALEKKLFQ